MRHLLTAGLLLAGMSVAQAQNITPGIGGVAVTGQSGAGLYIPYSGGGVTFGAPGIGSYNTNGSGYTSPFSYSQFSNPYAYNFNSGTFNYNSGVYGWNNGLTTSGYYGSPYGNVIQTSGYGGYYPYSSGYSNYPYSGSSWGSSYGGSVYSPVVYTSGGGRMRGRGR